MSKLSIQDGHPNLLAVAREALALAERNICRHETLKRGGVIWTICADCGAMWADDRGGFKPNPAAEQLDALRKALDRELKRNVSPLDRIERQNLASVFDRAEDWCGSLAPEDAENERRTTRDLRKHVAALFGFKLPRFGVPKRKRKRSRR